eukprot:11670475-Alexandrium_andersonii.AAC.1
MAVMLYHATAAQMLQFQQFDQLKLHLSAAHGAAVPARCASAACVRATVAVASLVGVQWDACVRVCGCVRARA